MSRKDVSRQTPGLYFNASYLFENLSGFHGILTLATIHYLINLVVVFSWIFIFVNEEQVSAAMGFAAKLRGPGMQFFSVIIGTTFLGVILSLIVSIFIRKEGDPYKQAMSEIETPDKE